MADGPGRRRRARGARRRRPVAAADLPGDALHPVMRRRRSSRTPGRARTGHRVNIRYTRDGPVTLSKHLVHDRETRPLVTSPCPTPRVPPTEEQRMFSKPEEVLAFIKSEDVKFVDVRFCDLPGTMQHFNVPAVLAGAGLLHRGPDVRRVLDPRLPGDPRVGHEAHPGHQHRLHRPVPGREDAEHQLPHRRPVHRRALQPRPASGRREGRGVPEVDRHRGHGVLRPRGRVLHLRRRPLPDEAERVVLLRSTPSRRPGTPAARRRVATSATRSPTRAATSPSRRSTASPTSATRSACSWTPSASVSSAPTTRSAPPASRRSTTASTSSPSPATRSCSSSTS